MADEQDVKRIDTSKSFNDDLPSSSPSARTTTIVLGGLALIICGIALLVVFS